MNYQFPSIRTIDDILPHIKGYTEFSVNENEQGYTCIQYDVVTPDTFRGEGWEYRAEGRGICFDPSGRISSRPFHKFFNVGEREATLSENLPLSEYHHVMVKADGSMIRTIRMPDGRYALGTKRGITDISNDASIWARSYNWDSFFQQFVDNNQTAIFEWCSPDNKIVVDYAEPNLSLLAVRDNETGIYLSIDFLENQYGGLPHTRSSDIMNADIIKREMEMTENFEGFVLRWPDGHMVKMKTEWYLKRHRMLDIVERPHMIIQLTVTNEMDDLIPEMAPEQKDIVINTTVKFWTTLYQHVNRLTNLYHDLMYKHKADRKSLAQDDTIDPIDKGMLFKFMDGQSFHEQLLKLVEAKSYRMKRWEDFSETWWNRF